jgi:Flp pilus assembly protein TadB
MWTNYLLALCAALGIFFIVISPRIAFARKSSTVDRVSKLMESGTEQFSKSFVTNVRRNGLAVALAQADLDVTPAGFYRTGLIVAAAAGAGTYVMTNGIAVAVFIGMASILMYLNWLFWRRDKKKMAYEEGLADIADAMAAGALISNTIKGAITHAASLAPEAVRDDFLTISSSIQQGATIPEAFAEAQKKRQSYSLEMLSDILYMWSIRGTSVPLSQVLGPLTKTIRRMAAARRRMESELSGKRTQMIFVAVFPFFMVFFMRSMFPGFAEVFASPFGQLIQLASYSISAGGYVLSERVLGNVRRVIDIQSNSDDPRHSAANSAA